MIKFGVALDMGSRTKTLDQRISECLPVIAAAEEAGFESLWFGESYPVGPDDPAVFHLPSPALAIAALARETGLKFGTGVSLLRGWDPLRLAYEMAELDQITSGRMIVGIGLGQPDLAERFEAHPRKSEDLDRIVTGLRRLWRGESYSFRADAPAMATAIWPLPVRPDGLPILVGGGTQRAAVRAATLSDGYYASTGYTAHRIGKLAATYRSALPAGEAGAISVNRLTLLAPTREQVRERARNTTDRILDSYLALGSLTTEMADIEPAVRRQWAEDAISLVGTPDDVRSRLSVLFELGVTAVQFRIYPEGLSQLHALETVRLLGEDVIPWCRERFGADTDRVAL